MDFVPVEEYLHQPNTKPPYQQEHQEAAYGNADEAEKGSLPETEGVAGADFQGFAGNDGNNDLQDHHTQESQIAPDAMGVYPRAEHVWLLYEADHGSSNEPCYHQGQQEEDGQGGPGQKTAMPFGNFKAMLVQNCTRFLSDAYTQSLSMSEQ